MLVNTIGEGEAAVLCPPFLFTGTELYVLYCIAPHAVFFWGYLVYASHFKGVDLEAVTILDQSEHGLFSKWPIRVCSKTILKAIRVLVERGRFEGAQEWNCGVMNLVRFWTNALVSLLTVLMFYQVTAYVRQNTMVSILLYR